MVERQCKEVSNYACKVIEENIIAINGVRVHLSDDGKGLNNGIELATGNFSLVRLVMVQEISENEKTMISVIAKVGDNLRWPVTKAVLVEKIDKLRYSFSVCLPPAEGGVETENGLSEILNYVVSFKAEEDSSSLDLMDEYLDKYACLSPDPSKLIEVSEGYNSVLARAISAGSQQIVNRLQFCSSLYSSLLREQAEANNLPRLTSGESEPRSPTYITDALQRAKELTLKTDEWSEQALKGLLFANGAASNCVIKSEVGKMFFETLPGESLLASLDGAGQILGAVQNLGKDVICSTSEAAIDIVANRCGENAGRITADVLNVAGHTLSAVWNVTRIAKIIYPAKTATTSSLKNSAKASVKRRVKNIK